jgi:hypothetical protein
LKRLRHARFSLSHFALASRMASGQREHFEKQPRRTLASLGGAAVGRGWIARSDSERDPGEGLSSEKFLTKKTPHPRSLGYRLHSRTLPRKGGGKRACHASPI